MSARMVSLQLDRRSLAALDRLTRFRNQSASECITMLLINQDEADCAGYGDEYPGGAA